MNNMNILHRSIVHAALSAAALIVVSAPAVTPLWAQTQDNNDKARTKTRVSVVNTGNSKVLRFSTDGADSIELNGEKIISDSLRTRIKEMLKKSGSISITGNNGTMNIKIGKHGNRDGNRDGNSTSSADDSNSVSIDMHKFNFGRGMDRALNRTLERTLGNLGNSLSKFHVSIDGDGDSTNSTISISASGDADDDSSNGSGSGSSANGSSSRGSRSRSFSMTFPNGRAWRMPFPTFPSSALNRLRSFSSWSNDDDSFANGGGSSQSPRAMRDMDRAMEFSTEGARRLEAEAEAMNAEAEALRKEAEALRKEASAARKRAAAILLESKTAKSSKNAKDAKDLLKDLRDSEAKTSEKAAGKEGKEKDKNKK
jgi:hypothetical protein